MSRSRLDGPATDQLVEVHADDARRVLDAVGGGPAHVLTDSISGLAGLHLAATEPGRVRTLVAEVLPDRERWRAFFGDLHDVRPVTVPGDHDAVTRRPGEFAETLRTVLSGS